MKNPVLLILPFYGALPTYFNFYLKSLVGKKLDVLFVTDLEVPGTLPENFKIKRLSFDGLKKLMTRRLGAPIRLDNTRRLCDFKPMWGQVFRDELVGYRYWAFGDCDLVYGNSLNAVIDEVVTNDVDIVSLREKWISGALTILKNSDSVVSLYARARNLDWVYSATDCVCFDECLVCRFAELAAGTLTIADCQREAGDSFAALVWQATDLRFRHTDLICEDELHHSLITVENGKVWLNDTEVPIFHFVRLKTRRYFAYRRTPLARLDTKYVIDDTGFYIGPVEIALRPFCRLFKKVNAIVASVFSNGLVHWINRLFGKCHF